MVTYTACSLLSWGKDLVQTKTKIPISKEFGIKKKILTTNEIREIMNIVITYVEILGNVCKVS